MTDETNKDNNNFHFFGMSIEKFSILYGFFLIFFGIFVSLISRSDSLTSYIPSFLGVPIVIFSFFATIFHSKKKLFMHIVVIIGILIFLGGLDFLRVVISGNMFQNAWADFSKFVMLMTGTFFNYQCIKSFIHARKYKS